MSVLFLTGAGISASAGIATYRDGSSSWRDKDLEAKSHATRYGNHLDELWNKHWGPLGDSMTKAEPTEAHLAIADFQRDCGVDTIVATQNIDNLHEHAGSDNIAHVHGQMNVYCMRCKQEVKTIWSGDGAPECPSCNSKKTRPAVVLFGEMLNTKQFVGLGRFSKKTTHIVVVGTSLNVFPFASLAMDNFSNPTIHTTLINKGPTPFNKFFDEVHDTEADKVTRDVLDKIRGMI